jgi:hypothetical protein
VKTTVCSPEFVRGDRGSVLAERGAARAAQTLIDKDRLIRHQKLAVELLLMPRKESSALIARARQEVERWRRERLCSPEYIDRWAQLLSLPVLELARAMAADDLDWGRALRQNSPWQVAAA